MKSSILSFVWVFCASVCLAAEQHRMIVFAENEIPVIQEEAHIEMRFVGWEQPVIQPDAHVEINLDVLDVSHAFHFTRIWWFRDQLYYANQSRDERAIKEAQLRYDLAVAQLMNDVLWMGGPRECVTVDEPE